MEHNISNAAKLWGELYALLCRWDSVHHGLVTMPKRDQPILDDKAEEIIQRCYPPVTVMAEGNGLIERTLFDGDIKLNCWLPGSNPGEISIDVGGSFYDRSSVGVSASQARELAKTLMELADEIDALAVTNSITQ